MDLKWKDHLWSATIYIHIGCNVYSQARNGEKIWRLEMVEDYISGTS